MPYIKTEIRKEIDTSIDNLINNIKCSYTLESYEDNIEGVANYTISRLISGLMKPESGWRYIWINRVIGTLQCVALEFYRRLAGPYEDKAIDKNGDLEEYKNVE